MDDLDSAMSQALLGSASQGNAAPPPSSSAGGATKGVRTNNPGNLQPKGQQAQFQSPEDGLKAMDNNLAAYGKQGINTLSGITQRWAPASVAGNNPDAYAADIAKRLGIGVNDPIDLSNPLVRHAVGTGIMLHENGVQGIFGKSKGAANSAPAATDPMDDQMSAALMGTGQAAISPAKPQAAPAVAAKKPVVPTPQTPANNPQKAALMMKQRMDNSWFSQATNAVAEPLTQGLGTVAASAPAGIAGIGAGTWAGIKALANGEGFTAAKQKAADAAGDTVNGITGAVSNALAPQTAAGKAGAKVMGSDYNPVNWPGLVSNAAGEKLAEHGMPALGAAVNVGGQMAAGFGISKAFGKIGQAARAKIATGEPIPAAAATPQATSDAAWQANAKNKAPSSTAGAQTTPPVVPATAVAEPSDAALSKQDQTARAAVLSRVGIDTARKSALEGNGLQAGSEAQLTRYNEPVGQAAKNQFDAERAALINHAKSIVGDDGSVKFSKDNQAVYEAGKTAAAPFDGLREYYDKAIDGLYDESDKRSGGLPNVTTDTVDNLLNNRTFKNEVHADDKSNLREAIADELQGFKDDNPEGLTVQNAEQFRQWLNKRWKNDNGHIIGQVKDALDQDVFKNAGEDVYGAARDMFKEKNEVLNDPKGVSKIFDKDPNSINRAVDYEKIPDAIAKLGVDQHEHLVNTLEGMPEELQPQAQQALKTLKAQHIADIIKIGDRGEGQPWNNRGVNKYMDDNALKLGHLFKSPEELQQMQDLRSAGDILHANPAYPGADAQTANARKNGAGAHAIVPLAALAGEGIGSMMAMPGVGTAVGSSLGAAKAAKMIEKSAVKKFSKGLSPTTPQQPTTVKATSLLKPAALGELQSQRNQ